MDTVHLKFFVARQLEATIPGSRGDDYTARNDVRTCLKCKREWLCRAVHTSHTPGDRELSAEFLRLNLCARGQIQTGDTGGEAQVILYA